MPEPRSIRSTHPVRHISPKLGEMAEWSIAAVLKTVEGHTSGGSNPSLSAEKATLKVAFFVGSGMRTPGVVIAQRLRSKIPLPSNNKSTTVGQ